MDHLVRLDVDVDLLVGLRRTHESASTHTKSRDGAVAGRGGWDDGKRALTVLASISRRTLSAREAWPRDSESEREWNSDAVELAQTWRELSETRSDMEYILEIERLKIRCTLEGCFWGGVSGGSRGKGERGEDARR